MDHNKRMIEIDLIRILAFFTVIVMHIQNYTFNIFSFVDPILPEFSSFFPYISLVFALGVFFLLSGFTINLQEYKFNSWSDLKLYFIRRFFRIFPLYWLALSIYIFQVPTSNQDTSPIIFIFFHFIGLEFFISPLLILPISTLWFIGLLLIFHLINPILVHFGSNKKKMILISFILFSIFLILRLVLKIIEIRFFIYYWIFVIGIFMSLNRRSLPSVKNTYKIILFIFTIIITLIFYVTFSKIRIRESSINQLDVILIFSFIAIINFLIVSYTLFLRIFIKKLILNFHSLKIEKIINKFSYTTYTGYLFHRPFFNILNQILLFLGLDNFLKILIFILSIPFLIFISYFIQTMYNMYLTKYVSYLNSNI